MVDCFGPDFASWFYRARALSHKHKAPTSLNASPSVSTPQTTALLVIARVISHARLEVKGSEMLASLSPELPGMRL